MITSKRLLSAGLFSAFIALAACGGGSGNNDAEPERAAGMLSQASSEQSLEASVKNGLRQAYHVDDSAVTAANFSLVPTADLDVAAAAPESGASALSSDASFTRTYTVENDVGEADLIKYDGAILYSSQPVETNACVDCVDYDYGNYGTINSVKLYRTSPQDASAELLSTIELKDDKEVRGLYVPQSGTLMVLQSTAFYPWCGTGWSEPWHWQSQSTRLSFYDTSDPSAPTLTDELELEGTYTASRQVDGRLYLISRHTPSIQSADLPAFFSVDPESPDAETLASQIDDIALDDLMPNLTRNGQTGEMLTATDCYIPTDADTIADASSITTISVIPFDNPQAIQSSCYTGEAYGMYMSTESLYLTGQRYEYNETSSADFTLVHKFDLAGNSVEYRGSAELPGTLGHGEQLDFRLSEHEGLLRIVTSEYDYSSWGELPVVADDSASAGADSIDHRVTVLRESASEVALETVAALPNESRPEEIGKPDERLYGVRFFGERAYMVTFDQIDPLYIIDLSNVEDPRIAGQLEVPGVSDFLHPVSADLVLSVGREVIDVPPEFEFVAQVFGGVKLELFNVADISSPYSVNSLILGGYGTYSDAIYDRHAFTYQANYADDGNDRFAIPVQLYETTATSLEDVQQRWINNSLQLFEVGNVTDPQAATLSKYGEVVLSSPETTEYPSYFSYRRSVFHDDAIYFLSNGGVWSSTWSDPTAISKF